MVVDKLQWKIKVLQLKQMFILVSNIQVPKMDFGLNTPQLSLGILLYKSQLAITYKVLPGNTFYNMLWTCLVLLLFYGLKWTEKKFQG